MNNTVVANAVQDLNERIAEKAQLEVNRIVQAILGEREIIAHAGQVLAANVAELKKLQEDVLDPASLGLSIPPEGERTANEETIARVFDTMNRGRQDKIKATAITFRNEIERQRGVIMEANERIRKHMENLSKVSPEQVTVEQVLQG